MTRSRLSRFIRRAPLRSLSLAVTNGGSAAIFAALAAVSVSLAFGLALTRRPWCDEGWFACAAFNLVRHGRLAITILDPHGFPFAPYVEGIHRFTFWVLPGYLLALAGWNKIFGFGVLAMRGLSIVWSAVALGSWYVVMERLGRSRALALLTAALVGIDHNFAVSAATGRMDMMCAALGFLAMALYLHFRETNFAAAVWSSSTAAAAAALTHANGALALLSLAVLAVSLDRGRIRARWIAAAAVPYVVFGGAYVLYVSQDTGAFLSQMRAQTKIPHRFVVSWNPVVQISTEIATRYDATFGLHAPFPGSLQAVPFYSFLAAAILAAAAGELRRERAVWILGILTISTFYLVSALQSSWYYLIYVTPFFSAFIALALRWLWRRGAAFRWAVAAYSLAAPALQLAATIPRIRNDSIVHRYDPAMRYVQERRSKDEWIVGSGEMGFWFGFDDPKLDDDARLGLFSHRRPEYIILDSQYRDYWFAWFASTEPATYEYIRKLLINDYRLVYDQFHDSTPSRGFYDLPYQVYRRAEDATGGSSSPDSAPVASKP